jgi:hypothetical protein
MAGFTPEWTRTAKFLSKADRPPRRVKASMDKISAVCFVSSPLRGTEKTGPHSWQIASPYKDEGPPAFHALHCRPPANLHGPLLPLEFVMGSS